MQIVAEADTQKLKWSGYCWLMDNVGTGLAVTASNEHPLPTHPSSPASVREPPVRFYGSWRYIFWLAGGSRPSTHSHLTHDFAMLRLISLISPIMRKAKFKHSYLCASGNVWTLHVLQLIYSYTTTRHFSLNKVKRDHFLSFWNLNLEIQTMKIFFDCPLLEWRKNAGWRRFNRPYILL